MNDCFLEDNTAWLITDFFERRYFSKIVISEGYILLTKNKTYYFSDARYYFALKEKLAKPNIVPMLFYDLPDIKVVLNSENVKKLFIDYDKTTLTEYNNYKKVFDINIYDFANFIKEVRAVKEQFEIDNIKKSCEIAEKSFYEALSFVKTGITEKELCDFLESRFIANGAEGTSFDTIVAFNENSAVPHHQTSEKILSKNSVILIDFGCKYNGYCSDCTRTVFYGEPTDEFVKNYNAVWGANELAEKLIFSDTYSDDADKIARDYLAKNNLDKYFSHSLGHGLGLEIHEYPTLSKRIKVPLKNNMVFTIEPGIYLENKYGIRIEDTVCLTNGKVERFFSDSKDLLKLEIK